MGSHADSNVRPPFDTELCRLADYLAGTPTLSDEAYDTARYCLLDSLGCALLALSYPASHRHVGPIVPGTVVPHGVPIPGTTHRLDPVQAAHNIGTLVRWLDYNDTWLAAEWGHPSDNLGAILATADHVSRDRQAQGQAPWLMRDVLTAMILAHEVQGVLALRNSFNQVGLDHVLLVKVASVGVATKLTGGTRDDILNALSQAFVDGQSLRTYRHAPNAGPRKSWAAGDACGRAVRLAWLTLRGEPGIPSVLTAKRWGFYDVLFKGKAFEFERALGSYVMEHVLFKVKFPAEFHAQTAVECALKLAPQVASRLDDIAEIRLWTQESAVRIISKTGPLHNPADRDHSLQYIVAVGLLFGRLTADDYEDRIAADPRIDRLRSLMTVVEEPRYTRDYLDPDKRSIANAIQVVFGDGSQTERVEVEYPIGHRRRRAEAWPLLIEKFESNAATQLPTDRVASLRELCLDAHRLDTTPVPAFMDAWGK